MTKRQKYLKKYQQVHRKEYNEWRRKHRRTLLGRFQTLLENANRINRGPRWGKRGIITITISFEDYKKIVKNARCFYCGGSLPKVGHGLDRIRNSGGYSVHNVRPCCGTCNLAKGGRASGAFMQWLYKVSEHWR